MITMNDTNISNDYVGDDDNDCGDFMIVMMMILMIFMMMGIFP